jgi:c-di-GMP-binding flagellar brake protein YcgR
MIDVLHKILSGNRRRYPRVRTEVKVKIDLPQDSGQIETFTRNLSASGFEIILDHPLEILSNVKVYLFLPDEDEPIVLKGQIVRSLENRSLWGRLWNHKVFYAVGVNFTEIDLNIRSRIIRFLQKATFPELNE